MATIVKRPNGRWQARVRIKGKPTRCGTFDSRREASAWAEEQEKLAKNRRHVAEGYTLRSALERYQKEMVPLHKGKRWEEIRINLLLNYPVVDILLDDMIGEDLQQWIDDRHKQVSGSSVCREFSIIRSSLNTARKRWRWMTHEPARDVMLPKKSPPRDRLLSDSERERLLQALEYDSSEAATTGRQQVAVAMLLAIETAMRQGEIWNINRHRDLHLNKRTVVLPETKNGSRREVPLSKEAVRLFEMLPARGGGKMFSISQEVGGQLFRRACQLAGIEGLRFHDLRHHAITQLAKKFTMLELARVVGHMDPRSLTIYYNETAEELAKRLD